MLSDTPLGLRPGEFRCRLICSSEILCNACWLKSQLQIEFWTVRCHCVGLMSREEKRAALNRLRLLICDDARRELKLHHGESADWRVIENELMKIARVRFAEQSSDIRERLLRGEEVSAEELTPASSELPAEAPIADAAGEEVQSPPASVAAALDEENHELEPDAEMPGASALAAPAGHQDNVQHDEKALDELLSKCTARPEKKDRERGVKAYVADKRKELLQSVREADPDGKLDAPGRDNAVRKRGRSEFDQLAADEQWAFALAPLRTDAAKGTLGRFTGEDVSADVADPAGQVDEISDLAGPVAGAEAQNSSPEDGDQYRVA